MVLPFFFLFSCYKFSLVFVIFMNLVTKNMQIREVAPDFVALLKV